MSTGSAFPGSSAIPAAVRHLADEVPVLHIRTEVARERYFAGPPREYVEKDVARQFAYTLAPYLRHAWDYRPALDREVCTSSISKPLTRTELISILSRAYEAGRASR